jgi:hypothetical protein
MKPAEKGRGSSRNELKTRENSLDRRNRVDFGTVRPRVPTDINVPVFAAVLNSALSRYDETIGYVFARAGFPPIVWNEATRGAGTSE